MILPLLCAGVIAAADTRPNIVLIVLDDQGARDAGWCGSRSFETPRMDAFARQGVVCTAGYSNGANCQPTRAALMSGQYAPRTGIYTVGSVERGKAADRRLVSAPNRIELAPDVVTWVEVLRDAGYATAHAGKWHLGQGTTGPLAQGFTAGFGVGHGSGGSFAPWKLPDLPKAEPGTHISDGLAEAAVTWMQAQAGKGPFVLNFWLYAVHTPIQSRDDDLQHFAHLTKEHSQGSADYAGMLLGADRAVGRVLDALDQLGIADNTLVVLTSDNGGLRGQTDNAPLRGGKGMLYEGGIRVPLAIRWPGHIPAGSTCDQPILSMDFYPTFVAATGCSLPAQQPCDGLNLLPTLTSGARLPRQAVQWHLPCYLQGSPADDGRRVATDPFRTRPAAAMRQGDLKLIEYFEDGALELYDLKTDPSETRNLASERPQDLARLHQQMLAWRTELKAPLPQRR